MLLPGYYTLHVCQLRREGAQCAHSVSVDKGPSLTHRQDPAAKTFHKSNALIPQKVKALTGYVDLYVQRPNYLINLAKREAAAMLVLNGLPQLFLP